MGERLKKKLNISHKYRLRRGDQTKMVNVMKGILVKCDPAMKQFLLHLDETLKLGRKFIIQELDEEHLFISPDILDTLQAKIDDLLDQISFPIVDKNS